MWHSDEFNNFVVNWKQIRHDKEEKGERRVQTNVNEIAPKHKISYQNPRKKKSERRTFFFSQVDHPVNLAGISCEFFFLSLSPSSEPSMNMYENAMMMRKVNYGSLSLSLFSSNRFFTWWWPRISIFIDADRLVVPRYAAAHYEWNLLSYATLCDLLNLSSNEIQIMTRKMFKHWLRKKSPKRKKIILMSTELYFTFS